MSWITTIDWACMWTISVCLMLEMREFVQECANYLRGNGTVQDEEGGGECYLKLTTHRGITVAKVSFFVVPSC